MFSTTLDAAMASFAPMVATSATLDAAMASSSTQDAAMATYASQDSIQPTQDSTQDRDYVFFKTQKGGRGLSDSNYGFEYTFVKESKKKLTFVCKNRAKTGCPAFAYILKPEMSAVWPENHNHGHLHSATRCIESSILKEQCSSGDVSNRTILQNIVTAVASCDEASVNLMSKKESIERWI